MEKENQTPTDEKVTNSPKENDKSQKKETVGEANSEKKTVEEKPQQKIESSDFASEPEQEVIDYKKKFTASQQEAIRLVKENEELKTRLTEPETENINKEISTTAYDSYVRKQMDSDIKKVETELSGKYPELQTESFKKQVGVYTKRFVGIDKDLGIYFNRVTKEPLTPDEYREFILDGITIAQRDIISKRAKEEGRKEAYSDKTTNTFATASKEGGSQKTSEELDAPKDIINTFRAMGVTDPKELKSHIAAWKKRQ